MSSTTAISEPCDIQSQTDTQRIGGNAEMAALRNLYELPYLAQFVTVNKVKFGFPTVDTEILEECLLVQGGDLLISDIAARILRHTLKNPAVRAKNFESHLIKLVESKSPSWNPLSNTEFNKLPAADKLKLLKWLADETKEKKDEIQDLLSEDVENLKNLEDKEIRVGQDSENRIYWYFQDQRLYRSKGCLYTKGGISDWQCIAITLQEWQAIIQDLEKSKEESERDLYSYLNDQLFVPIIKIYLENKANGTVPILKRPSDNDIQASEDSDIEKMMQTSTTPDQSQLIKSANPELSKVLSEPSNTIPKDRDKSKEDNSKKTADDRKGDFGKNGPNQNGGAKPNQENLSQPNQHPNIKMLAPQPSSAGPHHPGPPNTMSYSSPMNGGNNPHFQMSQNPMPANHPSWNGQQPQMPPYGNTRTGSPGMWGPNPMANPNVRPDISHNIVPDASLTPEQRQNREAGMATLRKIQEMLFTDDLGRQVTNFSHIDMARDPMPGSHMPPPVDEFSMYANGPPVGGRMPMGPGGQPLPPHGGPVPPGHGPAPHMMGPGMLPPGHAHPHHLPMGHAPMPPAPSHMGPGGPMPPHMQGPGPAHMEMGMYPGGPPVMHTKPPPPYPMTMGSAPPEAPAPRASKSKKRKSSTQSPAPQSPMGQPLKSPKYQIPPSPLAAGPPGMPSGMGPGFPPTEPGMPPGVQMYKPSHAPMPNGIPSHHSQQGNLMQAGPPEPFQGHGVAGSTLSQKPPPSYSQSTTKRGSGIESMATPPPQKQCYSQFENQELTIVKQPNAAYQGPDVGETNQYSLHSRQNINPCSPLNSRSSNMNNITSASLANLAKGVEQIQQNLVEGGPFKDIQQSGQHGNQAVMVPSGTPMSSAAGMLPNAAGSIPSSCSGSQPSVNNTFVNAHMSIGQVNIQNVDANQQHSTFDSQGRPTQMQQNVDVTMNIGGMPGNAPRFNPEDSNYNNANQIPNAAVKVQAKGANTLQYLPVSQQAAIAPPNDPIIRKQSTFEHMSRGETFPGALPNIDSKTPTSKISYYPDNSRLPAPPPQRLPQIVNSSAPLQLPATGPGMPHYSGMHGAPVSTMSMHPASAPHPSSGMLPPAPPHHGQFTSGHPSMMPPNNSIYSSQGHGLYSPMSASLGQDMPGPPSGMMDPMPSPLHSSQQMMMSHQHPVGPPGAHAHPSMMHQPQSPFAHQGPPDFGAPVHPGHGGYPQDFHPSMNPHPSQMSRQMSHPGAPPPGQMMMPPQASPYFNGPGPGSYMI